MDERCRRSATRLQIPLLQFRRHQRPLQRQPPPLLSEGSPVKTDGETTVRRQRNRPETNRQVQYQLDLDRVCSSRLLLDLRGPTGSRAAEARVNRVVGCTDQLIRRRRHPERIQGDRRSGINARAMTTPLAKPLHNVIKTALNQEVKRDGPVCLWGHQSRSGRPTLSAIDVTHRTQKLVQHLFVGRIHRLAAGPEMDTASGNSEESGKLIPSQSAPLAEFCNGSSLCSHRRIKHESAIGLCRREQLQRGSGTRRRSRALGRTTATKDH